MKTNRWRLRGLSVGSIHPVFFVLVLALAGASGLFDPVAAQQRPRRVEPSQQKQLPPIREPEDAGEAIRINSNLVAVPVSVTNAAGEPVDNLSVDNFLLEEDGTPQSVQLLGLPGKTPIEMALLFDVSGSVHDRFQFQLQAAARFLRSVLTPVDHVSIFSIGLTPKLVVERTPSVETAVAGTANLAPTREATAFYDAVGRAAEYLGERGEPGVRRVIVVISDGEDNQSERFRLRETLRELQRNDCLFYSINPSGPGIRLNRISIKGQDSMLALAADTGGVAFLPDKPEELDRIFRQIASELQTQYLLGYYSTNEAADGGFRRISARIANRPELRVRFRQGYYAPRE